MLRLEGCDFSFAQINIEFHRHINARVSVGGMSCHRTNFFEASMAEQDLDGSTFEMCDLRRADLRGCNLSSVNFMGSNLSAALISNATLTGANMAHADIDDLDFTDALDLNHLTISAEQRDRMLKHFGVKVLHL